MVFPFLSNLNSSFFFTLDSELGNKFICNWCVSDWKHLDVTIFPLNYRRFCFFKKKKISQYSNKMCFKYLASLIPLFILCIYITIRNGIHSSMYCIHTCLHNLNLLWYNWIICASYDPKVQYIGLLLLVYCSVSSTSYYLHHIHIICTRWICNS